MALTKGKIEKILVALDLSNLDHEILSYLAFLSDEITIDRINFIHALPEFDVFKSPFFKGNDQLQNAWQLNGAAWEAIREETINAFPKDTNIIFNLEAITGKPLETILDQEKSLQPDLLVVGDKDRSESKGILAKNIVRKSKGNVLFLPQKSIKNLSNILVPVDFSENAARALKQAVTFAKGLKDMAPKIHCVNVYEMPEVSSFTLSRPHGEFKSMMESSVKEAFDQFIQTTIPDDQELVQFEVIEKISPNISKYLFNYATKHNIGIVFIGAKGHSRLERLLMGSVTEKILSYDARIPVLVIK